MTLQKVISLFVSVFFFVPAVAVRAASDETAATPSAAQKLGLGLKSIERERVLAAADAALKHEPATVTADQCPRSSGGPHDFYSEGDYWWPNPKDPDGPYIQRDGMTNPENFVAHRHAMIRFSDDIGALVSAYKITGDKKYADAAIKQLRAWFVDDATKMNPDLQYAQAIKGVSKGRGIGVIDTVHLIEVARGAQVLEKMGVLSGKDLASVKKWFADYLEWMTTSKNGLDEMKAANNHGTCWVMQAAAFASFAGDEEKLAQFRKRYKEVLLPKQMAEDGSYPQELRRTKPYGYSLFNADAMTMVCEILSTPQDNLWQYSDDKGCNMHKAAEYIYPYIADKSKWPGKQDVMFWEFWPVRSPVLLFTGLAYNEPKYLEQWQKLKPDYSNEEVIRNVPIRWPLLWVD
jgi:hypothetical protein